MTIPDYQTMMEPVLRVLVRDGALSMRELANRVAVELQLTEEDRKQTIQSGMVCWRTGPTGRSPTCSRPGWCTGRSADTSRSPIAVARC